MVTVKIAYALESFRLEVTGHAGQAKPGQDIVCSAASILAYTTGQVILALYMNEFLRKKPTVELREGNAVIEAEFFSNYSNDVTLAMLFVKGGFTLLRQNYPQYVELIVDEDL